VTEVTFIVYCVPLWRAGILCAKQVNVIKTVDVVEHIMQPAKNNIANVNNKK
jgi:hypothetical protein